MEMFPSKRLEARLDYNVLTGPCNPRGVLIYQEVGGGGGLAPKFASGILVGAPNFASKNISDKYPEFCPLNFRYDPKIGTFSVDLKDYSRCDYDYDD